MTIKKYFKPLAVFFVFVLLLVFSTRVAKEKDKQLKKSAKITTGVIAEIKIQKGVYYAYYSFRKDSIVIKSHCRIWDFNKEAMRNIFGILERRGFPVIYSSIDASNSKILFSKSDFNEYKIAVDSQFIPVLFSLDSLKNEYKDF